jgi:hypothetical protein
MIVILVFCVFSFFVIVQLVLVFVSVTTVTPKSQAEPAAVLQTDGATYPSSWRQAPATAGFWAF